jgi:hypothetical protein
MEEARALRSRIKGVEKLVGDALLEKQNAKERPDRAVQIAADHSEDEKIQKLCEERHNQHASRVLILGELERSVEEERNALQRESAHLAQSALLNFIQSKRYTPSPLNFAKAMAGLPYISWRQSISRCEKHQ